MAKVIALFPEDKNDFTINALNMANQVDNFRSSLHDESLKPEGRCRIMYWKFLLLEKALAAVSIKLEEFINEYSKLKR